MMQETDLHRLSTARAYREDNEGPDLDLDLDVVREAKARYVESYGERFTSCLLALDPWKIIPSVLVSNAFSCSLIVLTLCTLAEVSTEGEPDPISFGLWSYSDPDVDIYGNIYIPAPMDKIRTCQYTPVGHISGPPQVFLDSHFRIARACGVLAVCIGFLAMSMLWLGVVRDHASTTNWRRWVGSFLVICCFLEAMTLWILMSGVCDSVVSGKYTNCRIAHGGYTVLAACVLWFTSGVVLLKWPRRIEQGHLTLAGDERDEAKNQYPEIIGFWQYFIHSLDNEQQIELPTVKFADTRSTIMPHQSSSLHDIFESFDDELRFSSSDIRIAPPKRQSVEQIPASGEPTSEGSKSHWRVSRLAASSLEAELAAAPRRPSLPDILGAFDADIL